MSPMPFSSLLALTRIGENVFQSMERPYPPSTYDRAFGGHVYAQAVWAAAQTVPVFEIEEVSEGGKRWERATVHNVTGHFILPGSLTDPFIYTVSRVRTGNRYILRSVTVTQDPKSSTPCFTCTCSFKRPEKGKSAHQPTYRILDEYQSVLETRDERTGKMRPMRVEEHPLCPGADLPYFKRAVAEGTWVERVFPGVEVRRVDMDRWNESRREKGPEGYRQLQFYALIGSIISTKEEEGEGQESVKKGQKFRDWNLHACAHLYASDRNSLFVIPNAVPDLHEKLLIMGSLSHTVIFHVNGEELDMNSDGDESEIKNEDDGARRKRWFCQEGWTGASGANRGMHNSNIWDRGGRLIATTVQDGMMREIGDGFGLKDPMKVKL